MYYGRTLTDMAPLYVDETIKNISSGKKKIAELEAKAEALKAEYEKMEDFAEKFQKQAECENIQKKCNMEFLNLVQIIGGFYSLDDTKEAEQLLLEKFKIARVISGLNEENQMESKVSNLVVYYSFNVHSRLSCTRSNKRVCERW